jgi:hypothetical protein
MNSFFAGLGTFSDVAIVTVVFAVPFAFAALAIYLRHQQKMAREATLRLALEKGEKLSPEMLGLVKSTMQDRRSGQRELPSAVFVGCALIGVGCITELHGYGVMLFFGFLGLGFILRAVLTARQSAASEKAASGRPE